MAFSSFVGLALRPSHNAMAISSFDATVVEWLLFHQSISFTSFAATSMNSSWPHRFMPLSSANLSSFDQYRFYHLDIFFLPSFIIHRPRCHYISIVSALEMSIYGNSKEGEKTLTLDTKDNLTEQESQMVEWKKRTEKTLTPCTNDSFPPLHDRYGLGHRKQMNGLIEKGKELKRGCRAVRSF